MSMFDKNKKESEDKPDATAKTANTDGKTVEVTPGEVTDSEKAAAKEMAPGEVYAKNEGNDENVPTTSVEQLESLKEGAAMASGGANEAVADGLAVAAAGPESGEDGVTIYSSHPIARYSIGRFHFTQSTLRLEGDDLAEFEELVSKASPRDQALIKKIDLEAADKVARNFATSRTRGVDTAGSGRAGE